MSIGELAGRQFVCDALKTLGIRRFVLGVHVSAFPRSAWDAGYGAPLSPAGRRLLAFAARLGFTALQLGPSGQISTINVSPYDGSAFARNPWSLGLEELSTEEFANLLPRDAIERLELGPNGGTRIEPKRSQRTVHDALEMCRARLAELRNTHPDHPLLRDLDRFRLEQAPWLDLNAAYEAVSERVDDDPTRLSSDERALFDPGTVGRRHRTALRAACAPAIERSELAQYLCHVQHARFRELAREHGLTLWGDLHVGFSHRDRFLYENCFTPRWLLGAPPSRTNPDGQPWGHPVLDPDQLDHAGSPARQLLDRRFRKLLSEYDGIRIDHPHGLVCPWIYRASDPDAYRAVHLGARAFETPDSDDADLARWAIARRGDLDPTGRAPYADDRVRHLDDAQVTRYARAFDLLAILAGNRPLRDVFAAEVLSTCPYPLQRVLSRHGLGRFRVTQKADPTRDDDVYRTEHARPEDWLMLGTHDTAPVFAVADEWLRNGGAQARAEYLAARLIGDAAERDAAALQIASSPGELLCAHLADLFVSRAENVFVFIGDLFGEHEPFNRAGIIHPDNWTARLPDDFEAVYAARLREGRALDIAAALRIALTRKLPTRGRGD
jgi:4-alpha-glucanotransferase